MSTSLPKTFRAAEATSQPGKFEFVDVPMPTLKDGEVLIKVEACGVCHSDTFCAHHLWPVKTKRPGHEIVGRVAALGPHAKRWNVGDRVGSGWHAGQCFECDSCLHGNYALCKNELINGINKDGGYAEYVVVGWEALARVPDSFTSVEAAPLMCAGVTVFNALRSLKLSPGSLVAVLGIGGLGHYALQIANRCGYRVVAVSSSDDKAPLAKELGAHHYINSKTSKLAEELQKLGGAKAIIATAFDSQLQEEALGGLGVDGTMVLLAIQDSPIKVQAGGLIGKRAGLRGWPVGSGIDLQETMDFSELTKVKGYIEEYPFEQVQEAYDRMYKGLPRFRAVITFPQ